MSSLPKPILVVFKKSRYALYHESPDPQVHAYLQSDPEALDRLRVSHEHQMTTLKAVLLALEQGLHSYDLIYRGDLGNIQGRELVIAVGGDGTFLEVARHITSGTPILGVNSDARHSVGFYCVADKDSFARILSHWREMPKTRAERLSVSINGKPIPYLALNDLFLADENPAATSQLVVDSQSPKSSGIIVSTALGSTAWMHQAGGIVQAVGDPRMQYRLRDRRNARSGFTRHLHIKSRTRKGRVYVDGEHIWYPFTLGDELDIAFAMPLTVVGDLRLQRKLRAK